ncbi:MAG: hypothetical protein ACTSR0_05500 [Candidatus Asgardarchaeia archaeon]
MVFDEFQITSSNEENQKQGLIQKLVRSMLEQGYRYWYVLRRKKFE